MVDIYNLITTINTHFISGKNKVFASSTSEDPTSIIVGPKGNPPTDISSVIELIARLQLIVSAAAGAIAVAMLIWGAVLIATAGGNEERVSRGKKVITYSIVGIGLIILASLLTVTFIEILGGSVN